jgi:hypothetical protein
MRTQRGMCSKVQARPDFNRQAYRFPSLSVFLRNIEIKQ